MQLSDFISETLVQIADGIDAANEKLANGSARVNPAHVLPADDKFSSTVYGTVQRVRAPPPVVHLIRFDVAVYAAEGKETKGGIGIMVGTIALGSQGRSDSSASTTSRIQFGIPMLLPTSSA